jgi:flagellar FliL protein
MDAPNAQQGSLPMAKKKQAEEAPDEEAGEKKGGSKMMPAAMISIALVAAGYFVGGRGGGGTAATTTVTSVVTVEKEEPEVETIIDLEPVNVNLAGGHYLRVAISIGMAAKHDGEEAKADSHGSKDKTVTTEPTAPAADLVLSTFSGKTIEELSTLEGRIAAREMLYEGLKEFYGEEVVTVFFTEFVMQ